MAKYTLNTPALCEFDTNVRKSIVMGYMSLNSYLAVVPCNLMWSEVMLRFDLKFQFNLSFVSFLKLKRSTYRRCGGPYHIFRN